MILALFLHLNTNLTWASTQTFSADQPPEQQPQGLIRRKIAKVTADITTEAATSFGYKTSLYVRCLLLFTPTDGLVDRVVLVHVVAVAYASILLT